MEGRGEHAEVEATLELVLCLLASTVREAFGFSEAALAKSSGFAGPQKQRVTSVYWYVSGLRLQGPVASRDVM